MANRPTIWIPQKLTDNAMERASRDFDVILDVNDSSADSIAEMSHKADGIIACPTERFTKDVVARLGPKLKIIANHSVGVDHCDLDALKQRNIVVTNTPDVLSEATAETAMLLMLGAARRAVEGDKLVRTGKWSFWSPTFMLGKEVNGGRLGIVGMGRIGQAAARMARGFNMEIHYHNRRRLPAEQEHGAVFHERLEDLLKVSDFLSIHCPATTETERLMNAERFAQLPDGAVVVNTARGSIVDEKALLAALDSGKVAAAGLDCFVNEPGGNPAFARYDNVFMLPHVGSATVKTRDAMGFRALDNLDAYFAGREPLDRL